MSDDLVNQLTLNFLISKQQLQKLNKKVKETSSERKMRETQEYIDRIKRLFNDLLVCQPPDDLLFEVKMSFDTFIEKSIYYFKAHDNNEALEIERNAISNQVIQDDIDFEKEEREIEKGNYTERTNGDEEDGDGDGEDGDGEDGDDNDDGYNEDNEQEQEEDDGDEEQLTNNNTPIVVSHKYKKTTNSVGVDDIQKLPLDWFQTVRQNYKKNKIK